MPNRLIKDSIYESDKISGLTDFQFRVWVALIAYVDDYGRGDARPAIIKGRCFPLRRTVTEDDVAQALEDLAAAQCIQLYTVRGKPYLCFPTWSKHQSIRNQRSKYPGPNEADADNPQQIGNDRKQLKSTACKCPRNPIQSNPTMNPNPNKNPIEEDEEHAREDDPEWTRYMQDYGNNIGLFPTKTDLREDMVMFFEEYGADVLHEFIAYTARAYPDNPQVFFDRLCSNHLGKGIRTVDQAQAAIKEHSRKKGGKANGINRRSAEEEREPFFPGETVV